jgi:predicted TIM-barrel fold metal-dependent hydrolase
LAKKTKKQKKLPERIIDVHTHLFNARYLPIEGIVAGILPADLRRLATLLDRLLNSITGSSHDEIKETATKSIAALKLARDQTFADAIWQVTKREVAFRSAAYAAIAAETHPPLKLRESAAERLTTDSLFNLLLEIEREYRKEQGIDNVHTDALRIISQLPESEVIPTRPMDLKSASSFLEDGFEHFGKAVRWLLLKVARLARHDWWNDAENLLEFFFTILKSEEEVFAELQKNYGKDSPKRFYVHHLLDMENGYKPPDPPFYPFYPTQLARMEKLCAGSGGKLFACAGFDPRRDDWEAIADDAIRRNFVGFKFYPPMGYRAANNDDPIIEKRLDDFFQYCITQKIPVFTHCTPNGFQSYDGSGENGHPKYWRARLKKPGFEKLILCLGHAGGGKQDNAGIHSPGWFALNDDEWNSVDNFAKIVTELCVRFENVFCEFAYLDELLYDAAFARAFVTNMKRAFQTKDTYQFSDKIMYGSDWHMPNMIDDTEQYLKFFLKLFQKEPFVKHCEAFFWKNAVKFFRRDLH